MSTAASRRSPAFRVETALWPQLQAVVAGIAVLSAAALLADLSQQLPLMAWSAVPLLPAAGLFAWRMARIEPRRLQWDGQLWRLGPAGRDEGVVVELQLLFDMGSMLLLRAGRGYRACYLPLARRLVGAEWGSLRATLHAARPAKP
ncbi:hypothetical protein [Pelomonas sp. KK5]|uniref:hypothetical protein n=1 Tax=Pelomonas sp. KK5 TaxID=1855730 RepID=UPI00097C4A92|nr:hypothetical protein [Pelomonas sp. KK5]